MAYEEALKRITLLAGADLSSSQYCFVKLNSSGQVVVAGADDRAIGVLQDTPAASGRAACVGIDGVSKVLFGGTVSKGAAVTSDANGKAVALTSGDAYSHGIARDGGHDGEVQAVILQPIGLT